MPEAQRERVDERLEAALKSYGQTEAREGLEKRVMARIRAEPVKRWNLAGRAALGACGAAVLGVLFWWGAGTPRTNKGERAAETPVARLQLEELPMRMLPVDLRFAPKRKRTVARAVEPKLAQFPTPTPLTEEERALLQLARETKDMPRELRNFGGPIEPIEITAIQIKPLEIEKTGR